MKLLVTAFVVLLSVAILGSCAMHDGKADAADSPGLSEQECEKIKQDYCAKFAPSVKPTDLSLRVYAVFDDACALFVDGPFVCITVVTSETVCGYTFVYSSSQRMYLYHSGHFFTISEAFEKGVVDQTQVEIIFRNFMLREAKRDIAS